MMTAGIVLFNLVILYIEKTPFMLDFSFNNPLVATVSIIAFIVYLIAILIKQPLIKKIPENTDISTRYFAYNKGLITILALYEFPALFANVVLLLTANTVLYIVILTSILFLILNFPTPEKLKNILHLSQEEYSQLDNSR